MNFTMLFPGQGSQSVGMLDTWRNASSVVQETFAEADAVLGENLGELIANGPPCQLDQTEFTQPAMLTADVACYRAWLEAGGPQPTVIAGHSLGEYAALVAAGALAFDSALRIVRARARAMQAAVPDGTGAMAAVVGLDEEAVRAVCTQLDGVVEPVNINAPAQIVIAGEAAAVDEACTAMKAAGAKLARRLPVSVPAHSRLMKPARIDLEQAIDAEPMQKPVIRLLHNVDAGPRDSVTDIRQALLDQVHSPVQWVRTQQRLATQEQCKTGFECGPGSVLTGLARRSGCDLSVRTFPGPDDLPDLLGALAGNQE